MRRSAWLVFLPVLALLAGGGCEPSVPAHPAYDVDIAPVLNAHCIRCHGAGDKLNLPADLQSQAATFDALRCYLDRFDNEGDCTNDPTNCKVGARNWASTIPGLLRNPSPSLIMPPPPAAPLDDWAVDMFKNWQAESPPVCSNAPNPDPKICPNGP